MPVGTNGCHQGAESPATASPERPYPQGIWACPVHKISDPFGTGDQSAGLAAPVPASSDRGTAWMPQVATPRKSARASQRDGQARSAPAWRRDHVSGPGTKDRLGLEIVGAFLADATPRDTATQVAEAIKPSGDLLLITGAHMSHDLPDHDQHLLSYLDQQMTAALRDYEGGSSDLAIILSGAKTRCTPCARAAPRWPPASPPSSTSPATPGQLAAIVTVLASDTGVRLTPALSTRPPPWSAPRLPDSPSIRMDVWKGKVIASTEEELLTGIQG